MNPALLHNDGTGLPAMTSRESYRGSPGFLAAPPGLEGGKRAVSDRRGYWLLRNYENRLHPSFPLQGWGRWLFCQRYLGARAALVADFATTKLDNRTDDLYLLYPQAKQFRANFTRGRFLTVGFRTMTKACLYFYTLYANGHFSRLGEARKNPLDCLPKATESDTLKKPLVNHAKSQSDFLGSNRPQSQAQQGSRGFRNHTTFLHDFNVTKGVNLVLQRNRLTGRK